MRSAAARPELQETFSSQGLDTVTNTPDAFAELIRTETVKWTEVVRVSGSKID
jgi:tripartite-type tricarboxylate transporter receptor subunit TctC